MVRKYLPLVIALILFVPAIFAQESLGDIARKLKSQKNGDQPAPSSSAVSPVAGPANTRTAQQQQPAPAQPVTAQNATLTAEEAITPDLNADVATDVRGLEKYQAAIRQMLYQQKFQEIDRLAADARASKARFTGGYWKVRTIYRALEQPLGGLNAAETEWTKHIALLEQWKDQYPGSITPRIALAETYNNYGWKARGGGSADQVADDGWQLLAERAHKGRAILEEAETLQEKCPEWFVAMIQIARSENWETAPFNALVQKAMTFEPDYYYYYRMMADSLQPKWGGEEGDSAQFAEAVADRIGGKKGDLIYFEIATTLVCACDNAARLNGLSWPRIKNGYLALQEMYGDTISHKNEIALMAFRAGDFDYAAQVFGQIGEQWDKDVWLSHDHFTNFKYQADIPRIKRSMAEAKANAQTNEGQLFSNLLGSEIEKQYHQKLLECMTKLPDDKPPVVWLLMQLAKNGSVRDVIFAGSGAPVACFRPQLDKAALPVPPKPDYWVMVHMNAQ
jgi:hypothetical protein